mmetsp:Transcript_4589/g.7123  ORF Transcript_4589/g.7123 Transcript_4589/m.7123 type:complete len:491 (-) Transcript_4589:65-1537(-)
MRNSSSNNNHEYTYQKVGEDDDSVDECIFETTNNILQDDDDDASWKEDDDDLLVSFPTRRNTNDNEMVEGNGRDVIPEDLDLDDERVIQPGDHIFVWRSYGVPRAYQSHAIVLSVENPKDEESIRVVSFYHRTENNETNQHHQRDYYVDEGASSLLNETETACSAASVREESLLSFRENKQIQHKKVLSDVKFVQYGAAWGQRLLRRGGTCTACHPDELPLVVFRARYLLDHPGSLPPYHALKSNGECAAVWCRLGRWCTLQSSSMLGMIAFSQLGGAAVGGIIAANTTVYVPMSGVLGAYGWVWVMPATMAFPLLMPTFVAIGMASLFPLILLWRFRRQWGKITLTLNHEFWLRSDETVRERFFGTSNDSNEEFTKNFFGLDKNYEDVPEEEDEHTGKYMPLGSRGMDDDDDENKDDEPELMKQHLEAVAEAYEQDGNTGKNNYQRSNSWQQRLGNLGKRLSFRRSNNIEDIPEEHTEHFYANSVNGCK